jgi:hypothetical protein
MENSRSLYSTVAFLQRTPTRRLLTNRFGLSLTRTDSYWDMRIGEWQRFLHAVRVLSDLLSLSPGRTAQHSTSSRTGDAALCGQFLLQLRRILSDHPQAQILCASRWVRPASDWLRHRCGLCSVLVTRHRRRTRVCGGRLWHCDARHHQGGHWRYRRASRRVGRRHGNDSPSDRFCSWNRHRWWFFLHFSRRANGPSGIRSRFQQFGGDECGPAHSGMRPVSMPSRRETNYSCALTVLKTQPRHFNRKENNEQP